MCKVFTLLMKSYLSNTVRESSPAIVTNHQSYPTTTICENEYPASSPKDRHLGGPAASVASAVGRQFDRVNSNGVVGDFITATDAASHFSRSSVISFEGICAAAPLMSNETPLWNLDTPRAFVEHYHICAALPPEVSA